MKDIRKITDFETPSVFSALAPFFIEYYVMGFIIAYFYKNITRFKVFNVFQFIPMNPLIFLLQRPLGAMACFMPNDSSLCKIREYLDAFIDENNFYVENDDFITKLIFDFFTDLPPQITALFAIIGTPKIIADFKQNVHLRPDIDTSAVVDSNS